MRIVLATIEKLFARDKFEIKNNCGKKYVFGAAIEYVICRAGWAFSTRVLSILRLVFLIFFLIFLNSYSIIFCYNDVLFYFFFIATLFYYDKTLKKVKQKS